MCLVPIVSRASEIPQPVLPAGVGVNIHFVTGHEKDLDMIAAAGFKFIRMDLGWSGTEPRKGEYNWTGFDQLLANMEKRGIRPLFILDFSNPLYEPPAASTNAAPQRRSTPSPQHPESVAAFARWAAAAARHFRGHHVLWEIWNEPNIGFWSPKPDVNQYTTLALATCKAVREADPQAAIIAPASSAFPWEFLETFFKSGVLEYLEAVSVHPYRGPREAPETAAADYRRLRRLIDRYAPPAKKEKIPILCGEWGFATFSGGVSLETQAAFAARQQLANLLSDVPLSIWYDWKDDGTNPNDKEHHFGTVLPDLTPKPSYFAIQTLTRELAGCRVTRKLKLANESDYVLLCTGPAGTQKLAAWTLGEPHAVSIELAAAGTAKLGAVKVDGSSFVPTLDAGRLVLDLTAAPQYVTLGETTVKGQ